MRIDGIKLAVWSVAFLTALVGPGELWDKSGLSIEGLIHGLQGETRKPACQGSYTTPIGTKVTEVFNKYSGKAHIQVEYMDGSIYEGYLPPPEKKLGETETEFSDRIQNNRLLLSRLCSDLDLKNRNFVDVIKQNYGVEFMLTTAGANAYEEKRPRSKTRSSLNLN